MQKRLIIPTLILFCSGCLYALTPLDNTKQVVAEQSEKLANSIASESLASLEEVFDSEATILPEYHKMLCGTMAITSYFKAFFAKTETVSYQKHPFEIQQIADGFLELGTFKHQYKTPKDSLFNYNGKYMTFWKLQDNRPKIVAHIWGASSYFEAEHLDFLKLDAPDIEIDIPQTQWKEDIEEVRAYVYKAVLEGDAKTQMHSYAEDAIYMTYYDPPFIGKTRIANYFYPHYSPNVTRDSLMTRASRIIDLGKYALKFGEYHVEWIYQNKPYFIKGKGLALYRRKKDGGIEIYRQMINHSMPASPKD